MSSAHYSVLVQDDIEEKKEEEDSALRKDEKLEQKYLKILSVVLLYWFVSISMVFLNKHLLNEQSSLDASLFITWSQFYNIILESWTVYY